MVTVNQPIVHNPPDLVIPFPQVSSGLENPDQWDANWQTIQRHGHPVATAAGGKRYATVVVAASNSLHHAAADADFVCTGTNDHTTINNAINTLPSAGGVVLLMEGTYNIAGQVNGNGVTDLRGMGENNFETFLNVKYALATNGVALTGFMTVENLAIQNTVAQANSGISLLNGAFVVREVLFNSTMSAASLNAGIFCVSGAGSPSPGWIINCQATGGANWLGFDAAGGAILGGLYATSIGTGVRVNGADQIVRGSILASCLQGLTCANSSSDTLVTGCLLHDNGDATHDQITVDGTRNDFTNNVVRKGSASPRNAIRVLAGSTAALLNGNDLRLGYVTAAINDAGAGTIFGMTGAPANPGWNLT